MSRVSMGSDKLELQQSSNQTNFNRSNVQKVISRSIFFGNVADLFSPTYFPTIPHHHHHQQPSFFPTTCPTTYHQLRWVQVWAGLFEFKPSSSYYSGLIWFESIPNANNLRIIVWTHRYIFSYFYLNELRDSVMLKVLISKFSC